MITKTFIRNPLTHNRDANDWQASSHKWLIDINGQTFDFYTGAAHREYRKGQGKHTLIEHGGLRGIFDMVKRLPVDEWDKYTHPTPPEDDDVLQALVMDAEACEISFHEWCDNFGCDTDSRKALETYLLCQENTEKLRKAGVDIESERKRLADY